MVNAVAKRRNEYAAGRILAHRAIATLGGPDGPILTDENRAPLWPAGITGSITHSTGYAAAAAARVSDVAAIGIDVEDIARFRAGIDRHFLSEQEIARHLAGREVAQRTARAAALFSAKEAFYKCQYPLTGLRLGFHDVEVDWDGEADAFWVRRKPAAGGGGIGFEGRVAVSDDMVATAIFLAPDFSAQARAALMAPVAR